MIQKRYEFLTKNGKVWTRWFDYDSDDSKLENYQKKEYWQLSNKLRNEYRVV